MRWLKKLVDFAKALMPPLLLGFLRWMSALLVMLWDRFTYRADPEWAATVPQEVFKRDCEYIAYTYRGRMSDLWGKPGFVDAIEVDDIYYSPDRLKLFAFLSKRILNRKDIQEQMGQKHSYSAGAYVGFRDHIGEPWQLYPFGTLLLWSYNTADSAVARLKQVYFRGLKRSRDLVLNEDEEVDHAPYGANLGERAFWSSLLWQKGRRLPGLYTFQARYQRVGGDPRRFVPKEMKAVDYPDELLQRFEHETSK